MPIPEGFHDRRAEGDTVLRQCQLVQLHLLYVLDAVCKELNLTYFLDSGSALGAARHNGFIPWDDDLDVGMPKEDYRRFLKEASKILPSDVILQKPSDCPHQTIPFAKLRDTKSYYCECANNISTADPSGIYLDIFPFEEMPEIGVSAQKFIKRMISSSWYRTRYFRHLCSRGFFAALVCAPLGLCCNAIHACLRLFVGFLRLVLPSRSTYSLFETIFHKHYKTADLYPVSTHAFEDGDFPVPHNLDAHLRAQYGDWHWIPPPDQRPRHARIIDPFQAAQG